MKRIHPIDWKVKGKSLVSGPKELFKITYDGKYFRPECKKEPIILIGDIEDCEMVKTVCQSHAQCLDDKIVEEEIGFVELAPIKLTEINEVLTSKTGAIQIYSNGRMLRVNFCGTHKMTVFSEKAIAFAQKQIQEMYELANDDVQDAIEEEIGIVEKPINNPINLRLISEHGLVYVKNGDSGMVMYIKNIHASLFHECDDIKRMYLRAYRILQVQCIIEDDKKIKKELGV